MGRKKKIKKGIESHRKRILEHFEEIEKNILKKDEYLTRYHIKEQKRSHLPALRDKMKKLKEINEKELFDYEKKIEEFEKELGGS
jgi:Skp family chaperone for outer membrane proteins